MNYFIQNSLTWLKNEKVTVFIPKSVFLSKYKIPYYTDEIQKHNWLKKVAQEKFIYQGNSNKRFSSTYKIGST